MNHYLTDHFTYKELTHTNSGLSNSPEESFSPSYVGANIARMAILLEKFRDYLNIVLFEENDIHDYPIIVSSCFRTREVNTLVGGSPTSKHLQALAFDIYCPAVSSSALLSIWIDFVDFRDSVLNFLKLKENYHYKIDDSYIHVDFIDLGYETS